jgi:hypothetical protein
MAAPLTLPLLLVQTLTGDRLPDVVTPLVDALYGATPGAGGGRHARLPSPPAADALAERS